MFDSEKILKAAHQIGVATMIGGIAHIFIVGDIQNAVIMGGVGFVLTLFGSLKS